MKLTAFHAGDGDCLLLSSNDGATRLLVDGGRKGTFEKNTREALRGVRLDAVCVSHIDDDHISGILRLVEDAVDWRTFRARQQLGLSASEPSFPEPDIGEVWHNAMFVLLGDDLTPTAVNALSVTAGLLQGSEIEDVRDIGSQLENLATGEKSSFELSRRLSAEQLGIPVNPRSDTDVMRRGQGDRFSLGELSVTVLGPTLEDLEALRDEWQIWINENQTQIANLRARLRADEADLGNLSASVVARPPLATALGEGESGITRPNVASLTLLVEDDRHSVLLTGDAISPDILDGLEHHQRLDPDGRIHVSVLKVQHHGAKGNVTEDFVNRVTADHYVFCGNGAHHNPELEVVEAFAKVRSIGLDDDSEPVRPGEDFTFWFTSDDTTPDLSDARVSHMQEVRATVTELQGENDHLLIKFMREGQREVLE